MKIHRPFRSALVAALVLAGALGLAACGSSGGSSSSASGDTSASGGSAGSGDSTTASDTSGDGVSITIGEYSWTAAAVETEILKTIAEENPDLGVSSVKTVPVEPAAGWVGIERGDINVMPEINLPNQQEFADKAKSSVNLVSKTYDGAIQGWFVPAYTVEGPNAPAAGLKSIDELNEYKDVFDDTLYDGAAGWITTQQNTKRIAAYDLELKHSMSSEAALLAQVISDYEQEKPVLFFSYQPQWIFKKYDLVQLEEPTPYHEGCFTGSENACGIPTQEVWVAATKQLQTEAPKYYAMLQHFQISLDEIDVVLNEVHETGEKPSEAASKWIEAHKSEVQEWLS
jgi:glycine betaine/proline transport system substrate-binding protein